MILTSEQKAKIAEIISRHTYPKDQLGFFTMYELIELITKVIEDES